eukprot:PITA_08952
MLDDKEMQVFATKEELDISARGSTILEAELPLIRLETTIEQAAESRKEILKRPEEPKKDSPGKVEEAKKEVKELEKTQSTFNLESEIGKLKIPIPFAELLRNEQYRKIIFSMVKSSDNDQVNINSQDSLNLDDDAPEFVFGPHVTSINDDVPPFYVSLNIHDMILHNAMLDSGVSHNLMPKSVMDHLGLQTTRPYKDLFSFDSRKVKCLVVTLAQIPAKSVMMDIVVVDIPASFDSLATVANTFRIPIYPNEKYEITVTHRPSISNNIRHWQVFEDDQKIRRFLERTNQFLSTPIDKDEDEATEEDLEATIFLNVVARHDIIQLNNNIIPRGLVPLERLFDTNDVVVKPIILPSDGEMEHYNLGIEENPKMVKVSNTLKIEHKPHYAELLKEFSDVFSWRYEDLKVYDKIVIQHTIPLKENENPFKQKLRRINPKLLPLIEKEVKRLLVAKIIIPLRFSTWIANLVPVRKKSKDYYTS